MDSGATVNAIAMESNIKETEDPAVVHCIGRRTALGRRRNSPEISGAAAFLASDEASTITGQYAS